MLLEYMTMTVTKNIKHFTTIEPFPDNNIESAVPDM